MAGPAQINSSIDLTIGVSPFVGGLRGSATWVGRANGRNGSLGNTVARGENNPSFGVGGCSTKRRPAKSDPNGSCNGLFVMVSTLGDMSASSSSKVAAGNIGTCRSGDACWCSSSTGDGSSGRCIGTNPPNPPKPAPLFLFSKRWAPKPGDGGGFPKAGGAKPGESGGLDRVMGARPPRGAGGGVFDNLRGAKPGDGGGLEKFMGANPGDGGGFENDGGANPGDKGGLGNPGDGGGLSIAEEPKELDETNPESG